MLFKRGMLTPNLVGSLNGQRDDRIDCLSKSNENRKQMESAAEEGNEQKKVDAVEANRQAEGKRRCNKKRKNRSLRRDWPGLCRKDERGDERAEPGPTNYTLMTDSVAVEGRCHTSFVQLIAGRNTPRRLFEAIPAVPEFRFYLTRGANQHRRR